MAIQSMLQTYYQGLARKSGWHEVLAEDFAFTGCDMLKPQALVGRAAYAQVIDRFSRIFRDVQVRDMIVDGDKAFVVAHYDYLFPDGQQLDGDVAEYWTAEGNRLTALRIFFDTLAFNQLMAK